jgi:hypothetical protein
MPPPNEHVSIWARLTSTEPLISPPRRSQPGSDGLVWPDGHVLTLPDHAPLHLLLELDRAAEPAAKLRDKATRYAKAIPRSTLADHRAVVILAVPNHARTRTAGMAVAGTALRTYKKCLSASACRSSEAS